MRKLITPISSAVALALAAGVATPAMAQDSDTRIQVKIMATAVLPDGEIDTINADNLGVPAGTQTEANNNVVPTVAIEYFFSPNISLETICCVTQHDVDVSTGPLAGAEAVSDARVIPATFTLKYHFNPGGVSPYIGAGPTYYMWFSEEPGAGLAALGATDLDMSDELGVALQAGIDVPVGDSMLVSLDAKKYWVGTTAEWYDSTGALLLSTDHNVDPWVLSAGVGLRF
ncbi:OmpW/AlkL family protein [Alteraurantiacibacter aquimixticola]|uniref:OmpW family protein n=1 Tax=Alteraurantiacibacter aquimixticola TaxID=2489173 RepID=A0A4T3F558_9SPHN|nr:OmpW family outer membrane protein [Alteraurantiacibacter aquimixticola]TIX51981.1 hypothetical protein E5222_06000 [Alteraurantiacibacter aquimixticola]